MMMMASSIVIGRSELGWCPDDRVATHGLPARRVFLPVDLRRRLPGHLERPAARRLPDGWTGYAPLQTQATGGMDSYLVGFAVIGIGMICAGFNLLATIITTAPRA